MSATCPYSVNPLFPSPLSPPSSGGPEGILSHSQCGSGAHWPGVCYTTPRPGCSFIPFHIDGRKTVPVPSLSVDPNCGPESGLYGVIVTSGVEFTLSPAFTAAQLSLDSHSHARGLAEGPGLQCHVSSGIKACLGAGVPTW